MVKTTLEDLGDRVRVRIVHDTGEEHNGCLFVVRVFEAEKH